MLFLVCCYIKWCQRTINLTPLTHISHGLLQKLSGMDLLSLPHGDIACFNLQSLSQRDNWISWVWTHWQEANERSPWIWFLPSLLQVKNHPLCILRPHRIHHIFPSLTKIRKWHLFSFLMKHTKKNNLIIDLNMCNECFWALHSLLAWWLESIVKSAVWGQNKTTVVSVTK